MLSEDLEAALNDHLGAELYASHLYLSMAGHCESLALPGAAHWMRLQSDEEREHALRLFRYIVDRGGRVRLGALEEPPGDFGPALEVFRQALEHERQVSEAINRLYARATEAGDYATQGFLQWFVGEQVEEERTVGTIVDTLTLIGEDKPALVALDRELGARAAG